MHDVLGVTRSAAWSEMVIGVRLSTRVPWSSWHVRAVAPAGTGSLLHAAGSANLMSCINVGHLARSIQVENPFHILTTKS